MSRSPQVDDLYAVRRPQEPALSPDGTRVVYTLSTSDRDKDRQETTLWTVPVSGGGPRRLTTGSADSSPAFSPDGEQIAFVRAGEGPPQLWLLPVAGGEPRALTAMEWGAGEPVWSPDGARIAFLGAVDPDGGSPAALSSGPVVADDLGYQADGGGFIGGVRQRVHVVDVATGEVTTLGGHGGHCTAPVWTPDGQGLYYATSSGDDPDLTFTTRPVHVDLSSPWTATELTTTPWGYEVPVAVRPGTGQLLCLGSAEPGVGITRAWLRLPGSTDVEELTSGLDRNVMQGAPGYPGAAPRFVQEDHLVLCVRDRGWTHLLRLSELARAGTEGKHPRVDPLVDGDRTVSGLSVAADGRTAAVVIASPDTFGEIATLDLDSGELHVLTAYREELLASLDWVRPRERVFTAPDGTAVHGWLLRGEDVEGPAPLLLDIHGGPHNAWSGAADADHLYHQVLAAAGWSVLILNPRGSDGYGEDFYRAGMGRWGVADADDFLAPLDELVTEGVADPARLAVTGYSYGGYMTCYLTSRDDRFAAAVPGGIVADTHSVATTSDLGHFMAGKEMGGVPWRDREHFDRQSPLARVDQVRTPTLVLHGADDLRCPVSEAQRWFAALRSQGVPVRLVLYPGASHLFILGGRPSHRVDYNRRVVDWVHRHTRGPVVRPALDEGHWQRRLAALVERHEVPGASLGILRLGAAPGGGDEVVTTSAGVLSRTSGHPVGPDSVFQIGSITKVWTATLVMQLVDEGRLSLDAPVREVLPELRLARESVAAAVTIRHLLTHTSGIDGDIFTDTGRGDDVLERYVDQLADARQIHPLGATFSYCNSGFNLLGRVIEKVTGQVWDEVLRERLVLPLGLQRTGTLPEEALLFDAALGHTRDAHSGDLRPASRWGIPRSSGPAGLVHASARDVLAFAAMHLHGGTAQDGTRVLEQGSVAAMQEEQVTLPGRHDLGDSWGLGWIRFGWPGERLIGHDGNTIGQSAFLRILPREGLAVVLLTNGGSTPDLFRSLYAEIFGTLAGVALPEPLTPGDVPVDLTEAAGTYERHAERIEVEMVDGEPTLTSTSLQPLTDDEDPVRRFVLHGFAQGSALIRPPELDTWSPVTFYRLDTGEQYVHQHLRATPRARQEHG